MPTRIYALAKELQIDSKELVEACAKAGITGKGSALASLDEAEVAKVKAFLTGGSRGGAARPPSASSPLSDVPPTAFTRDDYIAPGRGTGKIKVITTRAKPVAEPPATPAPSEPAPPEARPAEPAAPLAPAASTGTSPTAADTPPPEAPPPETSAAPASDPNEPIRPSRPPLEPIRSIRSIEPAKSAKSAEPAVRKPKRRAPVINVTPMPDVKQPSAQAPAPEPKAQKPEIRLPKDVLTGRREPDRSSLEKLVERKAKADRPARPARRGEGDEAATGTPRRARKARATEPEPAPNTERGMAGMASARADRKARRATRKTKSTSAGSGDEETQAPRRRRTLIRKGTNTAAPRKGKIALELPCTVRSFSESTGVAAAQIQKVLIGMGQMLTINSPIEGEYVELLAAELGIELELKEHETLENSVLAEIRDQEEDPESLQPRPAIITFLGHVDHGKTSLLDYIIGTSVVKGEAGGITQHIRAYQIDKNGCKISFVDTPGHEAFTEMRARGANVTDIAVLVIAADDGVMPQTEEAISHAKAANVPIIVALNKIDLPGVDVNRVMTQMTEHGLMPSEWGGDVEVVPTSATTGQGIDDLLETILTVADLTDYRANAARPAVGSCLEAAQQGDRGVVATLIVKKGTLKVGDVLVCGSAYGRVKAMFDTLRPRARVRAAGPSMPVKMTGFDTAPEAGEPFYVLDDIAQARDIAAHRHSETREQTLAGTSTKVSFDEFQRRLSEGRLATAEERVTLNLIIRADVRGSIEAIQKELLKLEHPEVQIRILQASVGGVTVADVTLAHASQAVIIGFNVIPDEAARAQADARHVEIRRYDIIYKVTDDIRALLEGRLKPEERVVELGQALVKQVFVISRVGAIAGCYVLRGTIERGCRIRVNRDGRTIGDYPLESLRREKDDVREVPRGMECGLRLSGFNDVKQDDVLEAYRIEEVARTLK